MANKPRFGDVMNEYGFAQLRSFMAAETVETLKAVLKPIIYEELEAPFAEYSVLKELILTPKFNDFISRHFGDFEVVRTAYSNHAFEQEVGKFNQQTNWQLANQNLNAEWLNHSFIMQLHLDDVMLGNGPFKMLNKSHKDGFLPLSNFDIEPSGTETICQMKSGDVLVYHPLVLKKKLAINGQNDRRIIELWFCHNSQTKNLNSAEHYQLS